MSAAPIAVCEDFETDALESNDPDRRLRSMTISQATDLWLGELERKNHSERTIDTYRRLLHKLADEHPRDDVDDITAQHVRRFLDGQARKRNGQRKAAATVAQNVSIVNAFFDWLTFEGAIKRNPTRRNGQRILARPKQVAPDENDNVTTVSTTDVQRLLAAADSSGHWNRRLAVYTLAYLGPRRQAVSNARLEDYDPVERTLTFREKGGRTIAKPVPDPLADLIEAAVQAGVYADGTDYLIPGRSVQRRDGDRDSRIIWHLIREVAADAAVKTHVHALRAAFAVYYLETHRDQNSILALKDLMGHRRVETTLVYLRRLKRRQGMETVRDLNWGTLQDATEGEDPKTSHASWRMRQGRGDLGRCGADDQTVGPCASEAIPATERGNHGGTDTSSASGRVAVPRFPAAEPRMPVDLHKRAIESVMEEHAVQVP